MRRSTTKAPIIATLAAAVLWVAACESSIAPLGQSSDMAASEIASGMASYDAPEATAQSPAIPPRFIRNASARIDVDDIEHAVRETRVQATRFGGIIADSRVDAQDHGRTASLLIRVTSDSLDALLDGLESLGDVTSIDISSTDISRDYFDTEIRIAVKEQAMQRLTALLGRSDSVEDLVAVERELSRVTTELESLKGQIRYWNRHVEQSDVHVHLTETSGAVNAAILPVARALDDAMDVLGRSAAAVLYLIVFLIPWLIVVALLWPVAKRFVRARRERVAETG